MARWGVVLGLVALGAIGVARLGLPEGLEAQAAGREYLAENAEKDGVVTLPSGLQIETLRPGKGPKPGPNDMVLVHYRGTLVDGTEFDSSYQRNQPAPFQVSQVIPGWSEGLQQMQPGGKYRLVVPSDLAYGPEGAGDGVIPPNAVLTFEVELLAMQRMDASGQPMGAPIHAGSPEGAPSQPAPTPGAPAPAGQ